MSTVSTSATVIIASSGTISNAIDLGELAVVGIQNATLTGTAFTFQASSDNATFVAVKKTDGTDYSLVVASNTYTVIPPADLAGVKYLTVVSGSTEGAVRTIILSFLGNSHRGAGGRTRTDMSLTSPDFESGAYTNFATPALREKIIRRVVGGSQPEGWRPSCRVKQTFSCGGASSIACTPARTRKLTVCFTARPPPLPNPELLHILPSQFVVRKARFGAKLHGGFSKTRRSGGKPLESRELQ